MFWHRRRCEVKGNAIVYPPATAENISRYRPGQTMRICKTRPLATWRYVQRATTVYWPNLNLQKHTKVVTVRRRLEVVTYFLEQQERRYLQSM